MMMVIMRIVEKVMHVAVTVVVLVLVVVMKDDNENHYDDIGEDACSVGGSVVIMIMI